MLDAVGSGIRLWAQNIPLLGALVLTIWLPGNLWLTYLSATAEGELSLGDEIRAPVFLEAVFGPIYSGA